MADKKNIVIKVKYPGQSTVNVPKAETVTIWHVPRIIGAVTVLVVFIASIYYFVSAGDDGAVSNEVIVEAQPESSPPVVVSENKPQQAAVLDIVKAEEPVAATAMPEVQPKTVVVAKVHSHVEKTSQAQAHPEKKIAPVSAVKQVKPQKKADMPAVKPKSVPVVSDKHLARAVLTTSLSGKEPDGDAAAKINTADNKPVTLYYFNELRNMGGQTIRHEWLQNGKLIASYDLLVAADRWRTSSHRSFAGKSKGEWQVRSVAADGKLLNQKTFAIK